MGDIWTNGLKKNLIMALANNTAVPVPNGWVLAKYLKKGDYVMGSSGKPVQITSIQTYTPREMYEMVMHDGVYVMVDKHAKFPVDTSYDRINEANLKHQRKRWHKQRYVTVEEMLEHGLLTKWNRKFYAIPNTQPIHFQSEDHPVPSFIVGMWATRRNKTNCYLVPAENLEYIRKEIKMVGWSTKLTGEREIEVRPSIATSFLTKYYTKPTALPIEYTFGSVDQRIDLLRGLLSIKPGCYKEKYHRFELRSTDINFLITLQGVCESLGIKTFVHSKEKCLSHLLIFKTNIKLVQNQKYQERMVNAGRRLVSKIEEAPPIECVHIETAEPFVVGQGFLPIWH